ncbi:uncharacterized protein LOC110852019 [Folsomia candida]|uniref:Versican core protein n=1 Tax=Folsomia candida TaxID=158441 RepID=A0A226E0U2_FOLCA|nr:uncharacterized protein LOC110852019 [Folsomia candida]OXA51352.1 Versican core protein [Folsomia candida]
MRGLLFAVVVLGVGSFAEGYVSHGEACDQSLPATSCNPSQDIACRGGFCECINTDDMEFDLDRQRCVVLAGGSCYKSSGVNYACVTSANCQYSSKQCVCQYQKSPTQERHCAASHGAVCNATIECNSEDLLVCAFDRCRCPNPINHVFKEGRNRCFIKVGAACSLNPGPNSVTCDPEENECRADLQSPTGYSCQCLSGFHIEHLERQCVRGYLQDCKDSNDEDIHPPCDYVGGLHCYQRRCQCYLSPDQAWDPAQLACAMLEGRGCALEDKQLYPWLDEYFFRCFTGLECIPFNGHKYEGICRRPATTEI